MKGGVSSTCRQALGEPPLKQWRCSSIPASDKTWPRYEEPRLPLIQSRYRQIMAGRQIRVGAARVSVVSPELLNTSLQVNVARWEMLPRKKFFPNGEESLNGRRSIARIPDQALRVSNNLEGASQLLVSLVISLSHGLALPSKVSPLSCPEQPRSVCTIHYR